MIFCDSNLYRAIEILKTLVFFYLVILFLEIYPEKRIFKIQQMKIGRKYSWYYAYWGKAEGKSNSNIQEFLKHDTQIKMTY